MTKKKPEHYVDNERFCQAMTEWKLQVIEAAEADEQRPPISEYIGECFVKIAEHLSRKPNFINYPFRDEMIADGIENCLMYAHNFNPEKSKNPFAYFTQITYYAFLRRIQKEKKQLDTKYKYIQSIDMQELLTQGSDGDPGTTEFLDYMRKQVDEANSLNEKHADQKLVKRRPKYLDDKQAIEYAKEKIDALKELDN